MSVASQRPGLTAADVPAYIDRWYRCGHIFVADLLEVVGERGKRSSLFPGSQRDGGVRLLITFDDEQDCAEFEAACRSHRSLAVRKIQRLEFKS